MIAGKWILRHHSPPDFKWNIANQSNDVTTQHIADIGTPEVKDRVLDVIQSVRTGDVFAGRGGHRHPGNIFYRKLVADNTDAYISSSTHNKNTIISMIIGRVKENGGRFLEYKDRNWICMEFTKVVSKVRQSLRHHPPPNFHLNITNQTNDNNKKITMASRKAILLTDEKVEATSHHTVDTCTPIMMDRVLDAALLLSLRGHETNAACLNRSHQMYGNGTK